MGKLRKKKTPEQKQKSREKAVAKKEARANAPAKGTLSAGQKAGSAKSGQVVKSSTIRGPKFWVAFMQFMREVRIELKKVTWPNRKQTTGSTAVVIVFVFIIALFLGLSDSALSLLVRQVLN